ncbi:Phosphate regulon sensor protein PhoR (SphS), partial [hydrothermal vent metagenome]
PLSSITEVAELIADGDYSKRLPLTGKDEIGKLAQAFNRMAESSQLRMESIDTDRNNLLAVLSGMIEGVIAVDKQERVVHINEAAEGILGIAAASSVGKPLWEAPWLADVCQTISGTLKNASETTKELRIPGSPADRIVEIQSSPIRDSEGNLAGAVVVLHDISELERLETMRRDFIANVSHELKTPITAIRGLVETLIGDRLMEPEKHERFLHKISNQSMRLSSIVTDLLTISRLESGKSLERKLFDLRRAVVTTVRLLTATGENRGVKIEIDIPNDPVSIVGDEESLCEAVNNLLDNGLKYSREGGDVFVRLYKKEETVVIEVEDAGAGIEKRDQRRIFERFYRVDKARSRELGGTGLGLSIVKHIAISHGGSVSVESAPGQGSTFRIVLPFSPDLIQGRMEY